MSIFELLFSGSRIGAARAALLAVLLGMFSIASCSAETPGVGVNQGGTSPGGSGGSATAGSSGAVAVGGSGQCPVGSAPCNGVCVNPSNDPLNCGACSIACGASQTCTNSACSCPPGLLACTASCVNPATDVANCGACGAACTAGQICSGSCVCQGGLTACTTGCANLVADGMNCGACGTVCPATTPYCSASACVATCPGTQTVCGTGCVDPASFQTDPLNCGTCGNACPAGRSCSAGVCGCPAGQTDCSGVCVDLTSSIGNCGTCGNACANGTSCSNSACGCAGTEVLCGTTCTNTQTNTSHCGACNMACPSGSTCAAGVCDSGGTRPPGCPAAAALLSDFEEGTGVLVEQGGRNGWWYVYADPAAGSQSPASSNMAIAAGLLQPPGGDCNKYAMHSTATGHNQYVGFGATLVPGATAAQKQPVSLSAYTGISFRIRSSAGTAPPIWFEFLNEETQPGPDCPDCGSGDLSGVARYPNVDAFNTRGRLITGVGTDWKTVTLPFSTLAPRYLPSGCAAGVCEAPGFNAASTLGFQYSLYSQFNTSGSYDLWVDDVTLTTGDAGLPTHTQGTGNFPFPQDRALANGCVKPAGASGKQLIEAYQRWKATFVTSDQGNLRVKRPEVNNDTVSEGIAYGMLIAVFMNDRPLFDGLWAYWKAHGGYLMTWQIPGGSGSAVDADEDAAFALIQAGKQWGSNYAAEAKTLIENIRSAEVEAGTNALKPGNQFGGAGLTNPSYFAPAFYRAFKSVDTAGSGTWDAVIASTYSFLNAIEGSNGLVPAWCSNNCTSRGGGGYADADKYQYDSHRTPWRMALDACWNNNNDARDYTGKLVTFMVGQSDTEGMGALVDLYDGSGNKCTTGCSVAAKPNSMSIIGTAAVGAMVTAGSNTAHRAFLDRAWRFLLDANYTADPTFGTGAYTYYNATVGLLTALTLSGNFNNL